MAARKGAKGGAQKTEDGFSAEERAAAKERVREIRARKHGGNADGERDVLAKIAAMDTPDRLLGERLHAIIRANAPSLSPRTWYGMPAYADEEGDVVCFFRDARKFKTRYATLGFSDKANLDDGQMWPTDFALKDLTPAEEARIVALVRKAVG